MLFEGDEPPNQDFNVLILLKQGSGIQIIWKQPQDRCPFLNVLKSYVYHQEEEYI